MHGGGNSDTGEPVVKPTRKTAGTGENPAYQESHADMRNWLEANMLRKLTMTRQR